LIGLGRSIFLLVGDGLAGDRAENLVRAFARLENEDELELAELAGEFLRLVQLVGLALGALALEFLDLALGGQRGGSGKILRDEEIAGVAGLDRHHVGFTAQSLDLRL
jgi:hypothetical protein